MPIHLRAEPGDYAPNVLCPGDPLRAKYIAETFFDEGARQRLQELAERTAQRDLRAALEAAAEGAEADEIIAAYDRASRT